MWFRWIIVLGVFALGYKSAGWAGGVMALVVFGFLAVFFYTACDAWSTITQSMNRPRITNEDHSQNLHVHNGSTMPGQPTSQEWAGIVEVGRQHYQTQTTKGRLTS
jgi:hypothetical protein